MRTIFLESSMTLKKQAYCTKCVKYFVIHVLKFEIFQTTQKMYWKQLMLRGFFTFYTKKNLIFIVLVLHIVWKISNPNVQTVKHSSHPEFALNNMTVNSFPLSLPCNLLNDLYSIFHSAAKSKYDSIEKSSIVPWCSH